MLVTECTKLGTSYFSQQVFGNDMVRSAVPWQAILAFGLLFLLNVGLLTFYRRFLPAEIHSDHSTFLLSLLSSLPYFFVCEITVWLPLQVEGLPPTIVLILVLSCLLALLSIATLERRLQVEIDLRRAQNMQHMLQLRQQQFENTRQSIESVRSKYHDMKNLLLYIDQTSGDREKLRSRVQGMLNEIRPYELALNTGNEAIDILLNDKLAVCRDEGISCTAMVDGDMLSFIDAVDLVTIFGNAMDNAIEACRHLPEGAAKFIHVRTGSRPGFAVLHFSNSYDADHVQHGDDGRLATIKPDHENHGFGLRSIEAAVRRYQGEMSISMAEGEFSMTLLFIREPS